MLILQFQVGPNAYAVDCRRVVEVVPRVPLRPLPHAPTYLAGLLHYRGSVVPVIDLGCLFGEAASSSRLSTRIILADASPEASRQMLLGLMAERVSDLQRIADPAAATRVTVATAPYLGPILETGGGLVQLVRVERMPDASLLQLSGPVLQEQAE